MSIKKEKIIIAVDDFGVSKKANQAILKLVKVGKIDRVAVMMGGKISKEEARELLNSGVKLDIHLHLLGKNFFAKRKDEPSINIFQRIAFFLVDIMIGKYSVPKIRKAWRRQLEDFKASFERYPDGINSHEHMHFFPTFFKVALKLKRDCSIGYIRFGEEKYNLKFNLVAFILDLLRIVNLKFNKDKFETSKYLVSFDWIENDANFFKHLSSVDSTELVFHPERDNEFEFLIKNF